MTSSKFTKRALISSTLAIFICVSMLIGTTFAWFTDTASTAVNKIQSGTLDVALEMQKPDGSWESAEGKTLTFKTADNRAADQILWEPGCTYELPKLRVVNNGNLALKYKIQITGINGDAKLNEVIDWTINDAPINLTEERLSVGQTADFIIKGHMQETAGNEYEGLTIDGIGITVVATQYVAEHDSTDNTYDESADYTIHVNRDNIQDYLDGKYGSINGMTLVLAEGNYNKLELGRATKYPGSNTDYYIGGVSEANKKTYDEFVAIKNNGQWSASAYYVRNMSNVTIKAAPGAAVTVAGVTGDAGHVYGECYDYVLDKAYTSGSAYYLTQNWNNIAFEGITFTAHVNIASSLETTLIDGVIFKSCIFNIGNTASGNQALRYYNENNDGRVKNLIVDGCTFNTCFQGVYTGHVYGVSVTNSTFNTTGHNAIAVQDGGSNPCNHGKIVITGNVFNNIGDRIIRFNKVGSDTQITIKNNTATNSGDSAGEVIKATSLADGIKYDISGNNWGNGTTVANTEFVDK